MAFVRATKKRCKLRAALFGPSGSGKTYSALRIATGLAAVRGKIAVIDTERGSASKYAGTFEFDVMDLEDRSVGGYCAAISEAEGYDVLIIDSLSHAWQELLEEVDRLASAKYRGNTWSAWSEGTPKHRKLVDALLRFNGHVLGTMRSKTAWEQEKDDRGKARPVRIGLAPEQGKGIEYEFDLLLELSTDHVCRVLKDRTGKFQDALMDRPDEKFGRELSAWLNSGETPVASPAPEQAADDDAPESRDELLARVCVLIEQTKTDATRVAEHYGVATVGDMSPEQLVAAAGTLEKKLGKMRAA